MIVPVSCDCGYVPRVFFDQGSKLKLRFFGCERCHVSAPARMTTDAAAEIWNKGVRNDAKGNRISDG
jgi:hypothetical protein